MTLLDLLALLSLGVPFLCSVAAGWQRAGWLGVLLGLLVGLALAAGGFWGTRILSRWVRRHPALTVAHPGAGWLALSWLLLAALVASIFGLGLLAHLLTAEITHHPA